MRIGFVYDLRDDYLGEGYSEEAVAEFDTPDTIAKIAAALERLGATVERVGNGRELAARLVSGARWDLVFSIAEGLSGRSREAQVPALCELFGQAYVFSDRLTCAATLDKAVAKRIVRDAGILTAPFAVLHNAREAGQLELGYPLFVKPLAEGTGKGCEAASRVQDAAALEKFARKLIRKFGQPVLVESFLPGREFTVGIVGNGARAQAVGVVEIVVKPNGVDDVYSFSNKENCETRVEYRLATDAGAKAVGIAALAAYRALECRDAARLDFRCDASGQPHFLEANPLAGLHPEHSDLPICATLSGRTYEWLMAGIVNAAAARYGIAGVKQGTLASAA
ncbi:MAG: hypothetical protein AB7U38_06355 [Hyphomicrobiales bacterium]